MARIPALLLALIVAGVAEATDTQATLALQAPDGTPLEGVVVWLLAEDGTPLPLGAAAGGEIDQRDREFVPAVSAVQVGAAVQFPNSDNIRHHVYSFSEPKVFEIRLYSGRPASPIVFDRPGLVVLGCNIHDHMIAWLYVAPSPYFAVSDTAGEALLQPRAAGRYLLMAWHRDWDGERALGPVDVTPSLPNRFLWRTGLGLSALAAP